MTFHCAIGSTGGFGSSIDPDPHDSDSGSFGCDSGSRVPIQLAKKPLEKPLEQPLEKPLQITFTGKTLNMSSLDMSQNQIYISSGFSSGFVAN